MARSVNVQYELVVESSSDDVEYFYVNVKSGVLVCRTASTMEHGTFSERSV
jgi:hypothetical protein